MAKNKLHISVFLSSPGDLKEERDAVDQIATELNRMYASQKSVHIEILRWESFARPAFGERVQEVINEQTPVSYDIFVGLLGKRFGTPTGIYGSGTEEEFDRAYKRYQKEKNGPQIMFYFRGGPMEFSDTAEIDQFKAVLDFKGRLPDKAGLYWEYKTLAQFESEFRIHLAQAVEHCVSVIAQSESPLDSVSAQLTAKSEDNSSEDGYFDYLETAEGKIAEATACLVEISGLQNEHTKRLNTRSGIMQEAANSENSLKTIKEQIGWISQDLDQQAAMLRPMAEKMADAYELGLEASSKALAFAVQMAPEKKTELEKLFVIFQTTTVNMEGYQLSLVDMKSSMMALPRFSNQFNRARRNLKQTVEYLERRLDMLIAQSKNFLVPIREQLDKG